MFSYMHWKFSSYPPLGWIELSIVLKHSSFHTKVNPWWGWVVDSAIQFWRKLWFKHKDSAADCSPSILLWLQKEKRMRGEKGEKKRKVAETLNFYSFSSSWIHMRWQDRQRWKYMEMKNMSNSSGISPTSSCTTIYFCPWEHNLDLSSCSH